MKPQTHPALNRGQTRRKTRRGGFTIAEIAMALIIFTLMTLMFAAVFPMAVRGAQYSSNYAQATLVAQHKMDQIRSAGYTKASSPATLAGLGIIDSANLNTDGSTSFTLVDNLDNDGAVKGYFPKGSTGTVTVTDYTGGGVPAGTLALITVKITWVGGGVSNGSYTLSTMLSKAATS